MIMPFYFSKQRAAGAGFSLPPSPGAPAVVTGIFIVLLAVCNVHLFSAADASILCYNTTAITNGEWWRIISHPFVHVSWYHLILDAAAVAILWQETKLGSTLHKLFAAGCCSAGSLVVSLLMSSLIDQYGLCGLSGTAHGLMFFLGLSWIFGNSSAPERNRYIRLAAGTLLAAASGLKSVHEVSSGHVLFASLHTGNLGIPIVESHLGGIVGGLFAFLLLRGFQNIPRKASAKSMANNSFSDDQTQDVLE